MINSYSASLYASLYGANSIYQKKSINSYSSVLNMLNANAAQRQNPYAVDYTGINNLQGLKMGAKNTGSALQALVTGSAFSKSTAVSSDTDALSVSYSGTKKVQALSIGISQLASSQVNSGEALKAGANAQAAGDYQVQIDMGGKSTVIAFQVNAKDTNQTMQQKIPDAINNKNIGVAATVKKDGENSTLIIQSKNTGNDIANRFSIKDLVGNAVDKTGVKDATQQAADAVYEINGQTKTSKINTVDLGSGITATLKKQTDNIKIESGKDTEYGIKSVKDFIGSFNSLLKSETANSRLYKELSAVSKTYSSTLQQVGINVEKDGSLKVDEEKLKAAAENGRLSTVFTQDRNKSYGFTNQLSRVVSNVERTPTNYSSSLSAKSSTSYYTNNNLYDFMGTSSQMNYIGMLFNNMI